MAPDPRVLKAFAAMRELGISPELVKPVLKNLLKLYNKDWSLIEADNFHTLVEAIYEVEDDKLRDQKRKEKLVGNVTEPPTRKSHVRLEEDQDLDDEEREPNKKNNVDGMTDFVVPIAIARPGSLRVSSSANSFTHVNEDDNDDGISGSYATCYGYPIKFHRINDITNGTEKIKIPLVDDLGNEIRPEFTYIPQNTIYQNAYVHVSLARIADDDCCSGCSGNCLSSRVPCACARETGGEYAYTKKGLLKEEFLRTYISMNLEPQKHYLFYCQDCPLERARSACKPEPCKGHLVRKFIKECWRKCGCSMLCGNRVVQRGITYNLQVFLTKEGKGWGLQTLEDLPRGAFVCEYVGEILTNMELYERNKQNDGNKRHTYPVYLDADWGSERVLKDEDALCLDATYYGNVARFINHRCHDANLLAIPVEVESPDHHYYHIAFFTKEKVNASEELTWDYGIDFGDHSHPIDAFECCCMSAYCRGPKREGSRSLIIYQSQS